MVIDIGASILTSEFYSEHFSSELSLVFLKKLNGLGAVDKMNRKQVVLVGPLFCISHQNQGH